MSALKRPDYSFRYFNGRTVRHYQETTGICKAGDHVVMEGHFPRGVFRNAGAAEVFCSDFSVDWVLAPGTAVSVACPICIRVDLGEAVSPKVPHRIIICRECGYHTHNHNEQGDPAKGAVQS